MPSSLDETVIPAGGPRGPGDPAPQEPRIGLVHEGPLALLILDHPPRNEVTRGMVAQLAAHVESVERDEALRAVVVAGAGETDFSGGIDLKEWAALPPKRAQEEIRLGQDALRALEHMTKPTVAAVSGLCRGLGVEIALACDLRIASETAVFSFPEVPLGWMPSHGGTARLPRIVGRSRALEFLLSGKVLSGLDALRIGLVDHLTPSGGATEQAKRLALTFADRPRAAVRAVKRTLTEGEEKPYRNRFLLEVQHAAQLLSSDEYGAAMERARKKGE